GGAGRGGGRSGSGAVGWGGQLASRCAAVAKRETSRERRRPKDRSARTAAAITANPATASRPYSIRIRWLCARECPARASPSAAARASAQSRARQAAATVTRTVMAWRHELRAAYRHSESHHLGTAKV